MAHASRLRPVLKRGALVTAGNWPLVVIQFAADSTFKLVLAVPVVGGALLVGPLATGDPSPLLAGDLGQIVSTTLAALRSTPVALGAFLLAFGFVLVGGSALMFLIKGGTVTILTLADRSAGSIERPPLRLANLARTNRFEIERFLAGCGYLSGRFLVLGAWLLAVYGVSGGLYLLLLVEAYRTSGNPTVLLGWTIIMVVATSAFLLWITTLNLGYLLMQMVVAVDDCTLRSAAGRVARFVRASSFEVASIFAVVFGLVILGTVASILAAAGLGLIAFVPFFGLLVFPVQIAAWILRGILFQYLGLTALAAYLSRYREYRRDPGIDTTRSLDDGDAAPSWERTA